MSNRYQPTHNRQQPSSREPRNHNGRKPQPPHGQRQPQPPQGQRQADGRGRRVANAYGAGGRR